MTRAAAARTIFLRAGTRSCAAAGLFGDTRRVCHGRAMAVVKSIGDEGEITLRASSGTLKNAEIKIMVS